MITTLTKNICINTSLVLCIKYGEKRQMQQDGKGNGGGRLENKWYDMMVIAVCEDAGDRT